MELITLKSIKERTISELIICILSILIGIPLTFESFYLIYAYSFTSILFLIMIPMTTLFSNLIVGLLLTTSGLFLFINIQKMSILYKLTGILLMLYPVNLNLLDLLKNDWFFQSTYLFLIFPFGVLLYLYFGQKRYTEKEGKKYILRLDKIKLVIGISAFLMIDVIFFNWKYL